MDNDIKKLLKDILIAIEAIESYIGAKKIFNDYERNLLLKAAVERNLITVGEAMSLILKKTPTINISNARKIVDVRNRLTHGYDDIDDTQIWNTVINRLPLLNQEVQELLNE